jgi:hypothetical protein
MSLPNAMSCPVVSAALVAALCAVAAGAAEPADRAAPQELDRLIERFNAGARHTEGSVRLDAWIETGRDSEALVVVVEPQGQFKLVADPGITVTPTAQPGVEWLVPLPYRRVDPDVPYFTPPASLRLPFRASDDRRIEVLVEYAYCVVDYQCFFGEQTLTVTARYD